jgi:hypothetical protein
MIFDAYYSPFAFAYRRGRVALLAPLLPPMMPERAGKNDRNSRGLLQYRSPFRVLCHEA